MTDIFWWKHIEERKVTFCVCESHKLTNREWRTRTWSRKSCLHQKKRSGYSCRQGPAEFVSSFSFLFAPVLWKVSSQQRILHFFFLEPRIRWYTCMKLWMWFVLRGFQYAVPAVHQSTSLFFLAFAMPIGERTQVASQACLFCGSAFHTDYIDVRDWRPRSCSSIQAKGKLPALCRCRRGWSPVLDKAYQRKVGYWECKFLTKPQLSMHVQTKDLTCNRECTTLLRVNMSLGERESKRSNACPFRLKSHRGFSSHYWPVMCVRASCKNVISAIHTVTCHDISSVRACMGVYACCWIHMRMDPHMVKEAYTHDAYRTVTAHVFDLHAFVDTICIYIYIYI